MSKFSEKCKMLLQENGSNVYQLSTAFSLDHTTLQRMVTGKRLPKIDFVEKFCQCLRLSIAEQEELMELYRRETMGEDAFLTEQMILQLLERLRFQEENENILSNASVHLSGVNYHSNITSNAYDTEIMLQVVLTEEMLDTSNQTVYSNLPASYNTFLHTLNMLQLQNKAKLKVEHLVHFQTHNAFRYENMDTLCKILPAFMSSTFDYEVFYYYSRLSDSDLHHQVFPYYVITTNHVLLLSSDFTNGIRLSDPAILQQYLQEFKKVRAIAKPLFLRIQTLDQAGALYSGAQGAAQDKKNVLHYQPCHMNFLTQEMLMEGVKKYYPDYCETLLHYFSLLPTFDEQLSHILATDAGIQELCAHGTFFGQLGTIFPSLSKETVLQGLKLYQNKLLADGPDRLLKSALMPLPKTLTFELTGNVLQIIHIKSLADFHFIIITESSICESFHQFFNGLEDSRYFYKKEEAAALVQHAIDNLQRELQE